MLSASGRYARGPPMRNFRSQFTNKIDAKGRVSVPSSFRSVIAEGSWAGICCLRSPTDRAIDTYSQARLDELTDMIEQLDPMSEKYRHLNIALNGGTWELAFDGEGRIVLPEELLHHARISEQATFVGLGPLLPDLGAAHVRGALPAGVLRHPSGSRNASPPRAGKPRGREMSASLHKSVLARETVDALAPQSNEVFVDATFGVGGISRALLESADCSVVAIDRDPAAIARGARLAQEFKGRFDLVHGQFGQMELLLQPLLARRGRSNVDGITMDLGVSSPQLDEAERGFSFLRTDRSTCA